ncbi:MAG TPA: methyltransferase [Polyangiaceae bacterium]|nr:methyltransferase [Polyangiaceae bacterium]
MELADVERLVTIPEGRVARLRASLRAAGLDERFVAKLARVGERLDDPLRAPMRAWHARRSGDPAATLARLFLLHDPVPARDAERVLGDLTALADGGLLDALGDRVTSRLHLALAGDLVIFGDRSAAADAVPPLNAVTALLARASVPRRPVERALDLGCGAGALALCLAAVARHVVATDVNPRALSWARFNARLNAVAGVDFRLGDLFEPARDDRFDLVVSQPPFVARRADAPPSAFAHGGDRGDELALRVVAGAASRLTPQGRALVLADWPLFDGASLDERVRAALGAAPVDAFVLLSPGKNLDEYCTSIAAAEHPHLGDAFARAACAQRDHFEALGTRGVAQALVVLEASGTGRTALVSVRHGQDAPVGSETVDRLVAAHALASGPERALLEARLQMPVGTRLVEQPSAHGAGAAVIVQLPASRPEWPFALEPAVAAALREIDAAPTVLEAARMGARRKGVQVDEAAGQLAAVARDGLRRGALEVSVSPEGVRPPFE